MNDQIGKKRYSQSEVEELLRKQRETIRLNELFEKARNREKIWIYTPQKALPQKAFIDIDIDAVALTIICITLIIIAMIVT